MAPKCDVTELGLITAATAIMQTGGIKSKRAAASKVQAWAAKQFDAKAVGQFLMAPDGEAELDCASYVNYLRLLWQAVRDDSVSDKGKAIVPMATRIAAMEKLMSTLGFIAATQPQMAEWLSRSPVLDPKPAFNDDDFSHPFGKLVRAS